MSLIAPTLETSFTDTLITQRNANPCTIAAYRDTWRPRSRPSRPASSRSACGSQIWARR